MAQREVEQWVTINGIHVPIFKGESKQDAYNRTVAQRNEETKAKQISDRKDEIEKLNGKKSYADHPEIQKIAKEHVKKIWNGGATTKELYDKADEFADKNNFNREKIRKSAFEVMNKMNWAMSKRVENKATSLTNKILAKDTYANKTDISARALFEAIRDEYGKYGGSLVGHTVTDKDGWLIVDGKKIVQFDYTPKADTLNKRLGKASDKGANYWENKILAKQEKYMD